MRKAGDTNADAAAIRKACDAYARKYIDIQRAQFKRLGVLGDWDNPYLTLNKEYEADELRLFADIVEKGFVYRGKKPVYWSIPCRTALAEAEVEYHDHVSQSIYVKFPVVGQPEHVRRHLDDHAVDVAREPRGRLQFHISNTSRSASARKITFCSAACFPPSRKNAAGANYPKSSVALDATALDSFEYQHPFCNAPANSSPAMILSTSDTGTGFVHIAPGHGLDDYNLGRQNGLPDLFAGR